MSGPREPRSAIWPWIVVPLITLGVFFTLRQCQHRDANSGIRISATEPSGATSAEAQIGAVAGL